MSKESLQKAVGLAGGQAHLARGIRERLPDSKIGQVHVWGWLNTVKFEVPPAETVLAIADFLEYRITPHELRPDLYPNPHDALPSATPAPEQEPDMTFGEFGEPRSGSDRREDERRKPDSGIGDLGDPRDGDRRQEDRRADCGDGQPREAEAA